MMTMTVIYHFKKMRHFDTKKIVWWNRRLLFVWTTDSSKCTL